MLTKAYNSDYYHFRIYIRRDIIWQPTGKALKHWFPYCPNALGKLKIIEINVTMAVETIYSFPTSPLLYPRIFVMEIDDVFLHSGSIYQINYFLIVSKASCKSKSISSICSVPMDRRIVLGFIPCSASSASLS